MQTTTMPKQLTFSVKEAAEITGFSEETIRRAIRADDLPAAQAGKRGPYRITRQALNEWFEKKGGGPLFPEE